jgi:TetR/AcrR family transcriptional regulator, transcriptional repressor for nem operon
MKVTRDQAIQNRQHVVNIAARLFREKGLDGISVANLMEAAGLTHGAFYGQFSSKAELMVESMTMALDEKDREWRQLRDRTPQNAFGAIVSGYLAQDHLDHPGHGCIATSLSIDAARQDGPVRTIMTEVVNRFVSLISGLLPGKTAEARRRQGLAAYATLVGAVVLSRAVSDGSLSNEIIEAAKAQLAELEENRPA